jgi:hypothetical protein
MKTFGFVLAAMAATAMASCPNQCSGHGTCGDDDKCECYRQTGSTWRQRVGWTGADCSQRTCPMGIAFDTLQTNRGVDITPVKFALGKNFVGTTNTMGSSTFIKAKAMNYQLGETKTFEIRVSDVTDNGSDNDWADGAGDSISVQWKLSSHSAYSAPFTLVHTADHVDYTANGLACTAENPCELMNNEGVTNTGIYIWAGDSADNLLGAGANMMEEGNVYSFTFDYQEGRAYEYGEANLAHQEVECSGRGSCDHASGRCQCEGGFTGEACQRTTCPNDCSGHGVCQDLRRFASDFASESGLSISYDTAYDARKQMGCSCDDGFRGPDCSMVECPSGADPMGGFGGDGNDEHGTAGVAHDCSGRGLCDYSSGICNCFTGFYGERCEMQTTFV